MPTCLFCQATSYKKSYLPSTFFNGKQFDYLQCTSCRLVYLHPLPTPDDYMKMYPPSYQSGVGKEILANPYKKLIGLRYSYGIHFDLIRRHASEKARILDYGCGNANFLLNALHHGFSCEGAEFNPSHVEILKKEIPQTNFYTIDDVLNGRTPRFDVIRLSNVLEHLDNPIEVIKKLVDLLNPKGILLIEGPIETNPNVALWTRKVYFTLRKRLQPSWVVTHTPTHIIFTNATNQRQFFKKFALEELYYDVTEAPWPYPNSWKEAQGIGGKLKALIAQLSMKISKLSKDWGNTFIYVGRKK